MKMADALERDDSDEDEDMNASDLLTAEEEARALEVQLQPESTDSWSATALSILSEQGFFSAASVSERVQQAVHLIKDNIRVVSQADRDLAGVWELELKDQDAANEARRKYGSNYRETRAQPVPGTSDHGHHERPGLDVTEQQANQPPTLSPVAHARKHTLNFKQTLAFLLLVSNALKKRNNPKTINSPVLVSGEGGTGKSRVINAFTSWLDDQGWTSRVRVGAPTATAASKINGETIHRIAGITRGATKKGEADDFDVHLTVPKQGTISDTTREGLEPVENIIIDEVSMLGHTIHNTLHQTCCLAKGGLASDAHMGGINTA
ncbi:hypothetical protein P7C70_g9574, partial [Phenoliferia sp. Uapishka_3]